MAKQGRKPALEPENQFPAKAIAESAQEFPKASEGAGGESRVFTWYVASAADSITPWGTNWRARDRQLREFWPTESFIAGTVSSISFRNASLDWELTGAERLVGISTEMLKSAIAGQEIGWVPFMEKVSQDLYTQDNGAFIELIRDEGVDANSRFKGEKAPVIGIAHLDSGKCVRTGDPTVPVIYTDRKGKQHKLKWYQVIPFSDFPSSVEEMNGIGYCALTRALRLAQILRSIMLYKDEKISGRHFKQINFVSGVGRQQIEDELERGKEEANNQGFVRFIQPAILASLDPEKPVSVATIDLASLPDNFNFDEEMRWYITGLALSWGVDYQELAPLPGGNIGSSQQSMILHRKTSAKGPAVVMRKFTEAFSTYGVLPRGVTLQFNDKDEQEALERQEVRTKAVEEMAMNVNTGILSPKAAARSLVRRGILAQDDIDDLDEFWADSLQEKKEKKQIIGDRGGNTLREDAGRTDKSKINLTIGDRLRKVFKG